MEKYVRCTIRRSNHSGEMYDSSDRPIGFGYNGKSYQLIEGAEVCLPKPAIYCFIDAVIEHDKVTKDPVTKAQKIEKIKIPRFVIDYLGFYVCEKKCNGDYSKCDGRSISRDEFFSDSEVDGEKIETRAGLDEVKKSVDKKKITEDDDIINDNIIEDVL